MRKFLPVLVCFLFCLASFCNAQQNTRILASSNIGYNLPEYPFLNAITKSYINAAELALLIKSSSKKNNWAQLYNYPEYGISLFYSTLGNDAVLGREIALSYFFRTSLYQKNKFNLYARLGIGLSYVTKKFSLESNYLNVAVGSHVNIHFNARFGFAYQLSKKIALQSGMSFNHFSNANSQEPNLGINYLSAFLGFSYALKPTVVKKIWQIEPHTKKNYYHIFASVGGKRARAFLSKFFITSSVSFEYSRSFFRKLHLGFGADVFWDSAIKPSLEDDYVKSNSFQTGIHISQALRYNKFIFSLQQGVYLGLTEKVNNYPIYTRGLIQYQINNKLAVRLAMKSHFHILDYPEIGFAYTF